MVTESGTVSCIGRNTSQIIGRAVYRLESSHPDLAQVSEIWENQGMVGRAVRKSITGKEWRGSGGKDVRVSVGEAAQVIQNKQTQFPR